MQYDVGSAGSGNAGKTSITDRISSNSEHDLVLIRLLSILPVSGAAPYFQEAYLAGTADITTDYDDKERTRFRSKIDCPV